MSRCKKETKRLYDIKYRRDNKSKIAALKKENYEKNKATRKEQHKEYRNRPENVLRHNEYCRSQEYWNKKRLWDTVYRAMNNYGEFWESAILINQLEIEVKKLIPKKERSGYKRNVKAIIARNKRNKLYKAVFKITNGDDGRKILQSNWGEDSKSILRELLVCTNF